MTRRRILRTVAVLCLGAAAWAVAPIVAGADEPVATGYWTRENGGNPVGPPITTPPPPDVPDGGLVVAADPSGPSAISALRFHAQVETSTTLALAIASESPGVVPHDILACPPASGWIAEPNGLWGTRPDAACAQGVVGSPGDGEITWALPATFKQAGRPFIEVVLMPTEEPTAFRTVFDAPGEDALTAPVDLGQAPTTTTAPPMTTTTVAPTTTTTDASDAQFGGPQFVAGASPQTTTTTTAAPPARDDLSAAGPITPVSATDTTGQRVVAAILLTLLGGTLWVTSSNDPRRYLAWTSHLPWVGSVADSDDEGSERVGGVGRFSRPRDDFPTRL